MTVLGLVPGTERLKSGALPESLTGLTQLVHFYIRGADLCAPLDAAFQTWLRGIEDANGPNGSG